jgi:hypothetical protein
MLRAKNEGRHEESWDDEVNMCVDVTQPLGCYIVAFRLSSTRWRFHSRVTLIGIVHLVSCFYHVVSLLC